jgi:hypothetical protein
MVLSKIKEESLNLKELDEIIKNKENEALIQHQDVFEKDPTQDNFYVEK